MLPPTIEQALQSGRNIAQQCSSRDRRAVQKLPGGFVDESNAIIDIHHQNTFAQMLDDEFIEFGEIRDVEVALPNERFTLAQFIAKRRDPERDKKNQRADNTCRCEVTLIADSLIDGKDLLAE